MQPMIPEYRAALEVELGQLSGLTLSQWADVEAMAPEDRALILDGWRTLGKLSWAYEPSTLERVTTILGVLLPLVAGITTVGNAVSAVRGAIA